MAGTWFRELAVRLAALDDLAVSAIGYDGIPVRELEVALGGVPGADPIVIDRDEPGSRCQITLERWLPISGDPAAEDAVAVIHAILAAGIRPAMVLSKPVSPVTVIFPPGSGKLTQTSVAGPSPAV